MLHRLTGVRRRSVTLLISLLRVGLCIALLITLLNVALLSITLLVHRHDIRCRSRGLLIVVDERSIARGSDHHDVGIFHAAACDAAGNGGGEQHDAGDSCKVHGVTSFVGAVTGAQRDEQASCDEPDQRADSGNESDDRSDQRNGAAGTVAGLEGGGILEQEPGAQREECGHGNVHAGPHSSVTDGFEIEDHPREHGVGAVALNGGVREQSNVQLRRVAVRDVNVHPGRACYRNNHEEQSNEEQSGLHHRYRACRRRHSCVKNDSSTSTL